jgi:hypothetical protein
MPKSFWMGNLRRKSIIAAAALVLAGGASSAVQAQDKPYSLSAGVDFTSHFISYGADVWGGGHKSSPFGEESTIFGYTTLSLSINDNLSAFVNVWSDLNDNTESSIGDAVQEVDFNTGVVYTYEKFAFTLAHGFWMYAGDTEHVIDFTVAYNDADMISKGFSLNPSVNVHWRYQGNGGQDEGVAIVPGLKPSYTFATDSQYPITVSVPMNVAFFSDDFQGGDSGLGFFSVGAAASVPLSFIPDKYGVWSLSGSVTYFNTNDDAIPGNPEEDFFVTALSIGMSI